MTSTHSASWSMTSGESRSGKWSMKVMLEALQGKQVMVLSGNQAVQAYYLRG